MLYCAFYFLLVNVLVDAYIITTSYKTLDVKRKILKRCADVLTSKSSDLSNRTVKSRPPTKDRAVSQASCKYELLVRKIKYKKAGKTDNIRFHDILHFQQEKQDFKNTKHGR